MGRCRWWHSAWVRLPGWARRGWPPATTPHGQGIAAVFVAGPPVVERLGEPRTKQELGGWESSWPAARWTTRWTPRRRRSRWCAASCPICPARSTSCRARAQLGRSERREEFLIAAVPRVKKTTTCAASSTRWWTGQLLRDGPAVRPARHYRLRPAGWLAGGADGGRPAVSRRRLDGGRLQQDHPLRRPGADVPSADRASGGLPGFRWGWRRRAAR